MISPTPPLHPPPPPVVPSFSSISTTTETIENSHTSISPSPTPLSVPFASEVVLSSATSDVQPPMSGSLQQLEVLLMNTFKKPIKTTGTAHSSDGEATNPNIPTVAFTTNTNNDDKNGIDTIQNESSITFDDKNRKAIDIFNNVNAISQQTIAIPPTLNESTHFDPLISTDSGNLQDLETLLKSTFQKSPVNIEAISLSPQISTTTVNDDISDLKSMLMNLSSTLLNKMNVIESKIDDHCSQTKKINHMLTNTILPSLLDLTDIIHETASSN
ncbi:unnamed protein product, partial [Rotaria magnacalcarata]